jgi:potassium channel LctB
MMIGIMLCAVVFCLMMSMKGLFTPGKLHQRHISVSYFLYFGCLYLTIMVGFALLYMLVQMEGHLVWAGTAYERPFFWDHFFSSLYFSGITLFSVGYGDIVPEGFGRWIALIEAWIGYTIPTAFVVRSMMEKEPF